MGFIHLKDSANARILVRGANWIGDAIMTTPVIRAVKKNFPKAHLEVLAKPWVIPVYENSPYVDEIMVYDNLHRHKMGFGTLVLAKDIKQRSFDLAVLMQNAFEAGLLVFLAGIRERLGYNTDGRGVLLNRSIKLDPELKKGHLIDYYIGILKRAGLKDDGRQMDLFISPSRKSYAESFFEKKGIDQSKPLIGINPGAAGGTAKRWFPERFARLCRKLSFKYDTKVLIFGGPSDRSLGQYISNESGNVCVNIAGETTLGQAFALINACALFITNDSGLMHAAAAFGVNQVAVIGPTDYLATSPANKNSLMIREPVHCSPCLKDNCPTDHACMEKISVDRVFNKCRTFL